MYSLRYNSSAFASSKHDFLSLGMAPVSSELSGLMNDLSMVGVSGPYLAEWWRHQRNACPTGDFPRGDSPPSRFRAQNHVKALCDVPIIADKF
jgi:hypothetical protein